MKKLLLTLTAVALATGITLAAEKADPATADVKVTISGNDLMKYDKTEITAKAGQTIAITLKNIGALPKEAMGHNLVVLKPGTDITKFAIGGIANKAGGFLPTDAALVAQIVANTKILGPKEEETIAFKVGSAGDYPYVCTFPGHFGVMKGVIKVK
ncbi:MAG: Azurin [Roseibacillus sp.]|jgi:azurin|nr:Azurin [Roseibacillus sp.]MBP36060.1 Azurin [Roseibacillus sp.]MCP4728636.1 Azurin [Roseibacillus sp.]MDP7106251.1 plastocyanin/azurin family copper-binding protein [Roseibacillus sp.]MDP7308871.1 plastocyanin/azurin family copper-binding protein [Roseibacillus sp.]|tara:strand:- start:12107 stop:12574 length:468 start_codon:yes stop_codon:yes gene_type:complete